MTDQGIPPPHDPVFPAQPNIPLQPGISRLTLVQKGRNQGTGFSTKAKYIPAHMSSRFPLYLSLEQSIQVKCQKFLGEVDKISLLMGSHCTFQGLSEQHTVATVNMDALENNPQTRPIQGLLHVPSSTFSMETLHQQRVCSASTVNITHWGVGRGGQQRTESSV